MNSIKKYTAFMTSPLLNILFVFSPILFALISYFTQNWIILLFLFCLYMAIDSILTFLNFGGMLSKKATYNNYIKSSLDGLKVLKTAIIVDTIRRFLSIGIIVFSVLFGCFTKGNSIYTPTILAALCITFIICLSSEIIICWLLFITSANIFLAAVYLQQQIMGILLVIYFNFQNTILNFIIMAMVFLYPLKFVLYKKKSEGLFYD